MAITICSSSSNHSPTLPNVYLPSLPSKPSLKSPYSLQPSLSSLSSSSPKFNSTLVSDNTLVIADASEAMALASAAAQAARDVASLAMAIGEVSCGKESVNGLARDKEDLVGVNRKKRRKRRMGMKGLEMEENGNFEDDRVIIFRDVNSGRLSLKEEAEYSLCFKEKARLEAVRSRITKSGGPQLALNQWAKAAGLKQRSMDRKLCKGRESQERICRSYRRLVVSIASGYQGKGLSLQDLIQEGSIGLLRGVKKYDPERGYKLSTYVYWWIRQAIVRAIANKSRVVRLPGSMCELLAKIAEANNGLSKRLRRLPTYDEIAAELNMQVSTVRLVSERSRPPISLDGAPTERGYMTLQEIIPGPDETLSETMVKKQLKKQVVEKLLSTLSEREASIVRLHFGMNGETPQSFEEIGRLLKLSRERVRQINGIALSKLQQISNVDHLKFYLV